MDWTNTLRALAPTVATALLGPLAGVAVSALGTLMGVTEATQEKIADAFQSGQLTPDQIGKLRELELEYQNTEKERGFRYAELAFRDSELASKDRDGARDMQKTTRSWVPAALSVIITMGFLGLLTGLMTGNLKADENQAMLLMLGALGGAFAQCTNFWLGSSAGSQNKDILLAKAAPSN